MNIVVKDNFLTNEEVKKLLQSFVQTAMGNRHRQ